MRITVSDTAVLRLGPISYKWRPAPPSTVLLASIATLSMYLVLFALYAGTAIAHTYPDGHTNGWFGLVQGFFAIPSFVSSWFDHNITIYQSPNDGFWYNLGFLAGLIGFLKTYGASRELK